MKCECSLNNNCEIIGLCDIQKFNKKINGFQDKSWTQISISDNLILSGNKPGIKSITKTFVTAEITSTKLISTPKSVNANIEGTKLTGKLLLVAGEIIQRVLYVSSNNNSDKINSFKIKTPFTTYIVVNGGADVSVDKYCIYSCVEYASLRLINDKSLSQNTTLFLFAHLITEECNAVVTPGPGPGPGPGPEPPPPPVDVYHSNEIIFNTDNKDKELAKIKFNLTKKVLEVVSTRNTEKGSEELIIEFELIGSDGITKKHFSRILATVVADKFVSDLNNKSFEYGDIINVSYYRDNRRVKITNHPNQGDEYEPKFTKNEAFIITQDKLVPHTLLNEIILTNSSDEEIVKLSFSEIDKALRVISTGKTAPSSFNAREYFKVSLIEYDSFNNEQRFTGIIKGNENGRILKGSLDFKSYKSGDIIEIFCEEPNRAIITNFPNINNNYNLTGKTEKFEITDMGLRKSDTARFYINEIISKNENNEELARVKINLDTNKFEVTSTGNRALPPTTGVAQRYFRIEFVNAQGNDKVAEIKEGEDGSAFKTVLDGEDYQVGSLLKFFPKEPSKTEITNYPIKGNTYSLRENRERFRISEKGFIKTFPYLNEIILRNNNNEELAKVKFNANTKKLEVTSSGNNTSANENLKLTLLRSKSGNEFEGVISQGNAENFKNALNDKSYSVGDVIDMSVSQNDGKSEIINFPKEGDNHKLTKDLERLRITETGLLEMEILLVEYKSEIILKNNTGQTLATVTLDVKTNAIRVKPETGVTNDGLAIEVKFYDSTGRKIKESSIIPPNADATKFAQNLQGKFFEYDDVISIAYNGRPHKVLINNYPNIGESYTPTLANNVFFIIKKGGIFKKI